MESAPREKDVWRCSYSLPGAWGLGIPFSGGLRPWLGIFEDSLVVLGTHSPVPWRSIRDGLVLTSPFTVPLMTVGVSGEQGHL